MKQELIDELKKAGFYIYERVIAFRQIPQGNIEIGLNSNEDSHFLYSYGRDIREEKEVCKIKLMLNNTPLHIKTLISDTAEIDQILNNIKYPYQIFGLSKEKRKELDIISGKERLLNDIQSSLDYIMEHDSYTASIGDYFRMIDYTLYYSEIDKKYIVVYTHQDWQIGAKAMLDRVNNDLNNNIGYYNSVILEKLKDVHYVKYYRLTQRFVVFNSNEVNDDVINMIYHNPKILLKYKGKN